MAAPSVTIPRTKIYGTSGSGGDSIVMTSPSTYTIDPVVTYEQFNTDLTTGFECTTGTSQVCGGRLTFTTSSQDLSTDDYVVFQAYYRDATIASVTDTFANGGMSIVFIDGSGNYSEFHWYGNDYDNSSSLNGGWETFSRPGDDAAANVVIDRSRTPDASSGTLDWTDVDHIEFYVRSGTNDLDGLRTGIGRIATEGAEVLVGGETGNKATLNDIHEQVVLNDDRYDLNATWKNLQGLFSGFPGQIYEPRKSFSLGNGSTTTEVEESGFTVALFPNSANATLAMPHFLQGTNDREFIVNQSASDIVELSSFNIYGNVDDSLIVQGSTSGTCDVTQGNFFGLGRIACAHGSFAQCAFSDIDRVELTADTVLTAGILRNSTTDGFVLTGAPGDYSAITATVENTNTGNQLTIDPSSAGTFDLTGVTVQAGQTLAIRNESATHAITVQLQSGITYSTSTAGGTVTVSSPTVAFTINSNESSSLIQIFTTGTQTVLDSTTGTSLVFVHAGQTVDYVVQKAGFIPQRFTGIVLSGTSSVTVNLVADPVYQSSHGLTYTTDFSYDRSAKELTVPTFGPTVREVYSGLIDAFIAQTSLRNTAFDFQMNGPQSMFLVEDAEGASDANIENMTDGGVRYISSADVTTAEWVGIQSVGTVPGGATGEYQQQTGTGTTDARTTGVFDELIKVYGDASHGNFDYRDHLVLKYQINGYSESRVDVLSTYGISALEPILYVVAMGPLALTASTGDPAISVTIVDHTAVPLVVGGKSFDYEIQDNGTNSSTDILREIDYNLSLDATYQSKDPFNWFDMVVEAGSEIETARGFVEDETGLHGVYVSRSAADHPGFSRFQSNDGTYYTPASTYSLTLTGLVAGSQVQIFTNGTTTILDSTASSGTTFVYSGAYSSDQTIDYVVIQAGYVPIRVTGVTVSDSPLSLPVDMQVDRAYQASSGLTFGTTATVDTGTSRFAVTVATTVQNWYSFMVESWRDETALLNTRFPLSTNGPNSISLNFDWEWDASTSIDNLSRDGMRYVATGGTVTASWCAVLSQGDLTGIQAEYQQVEGTGETDTLTTGAVDQLIQIYGDASHGNFDYTGHLVIKAQANGYEQARADVVATYGTLEDQFYVVSLAPQAITGLTLGDPSVASVTITDHGASPVTWNSKDFSITITDSSVTSGENILRWINYNLSLDTTFEGKAPFNWSDMVFDNGSGYETARGPIEGDTGATLKGVRVLRGSSEHPDFTRMQADDGTYFTPATVAGIEAANLTPGRVQLYNVTTATEIENSVLLTTGYSRTWTDGTDATAGDTLRLRWVEQSDEPIEAFVVATADSTVQVLDSPVEDSVHAAYGIDGSTVTEFAFDFPNVQFDIDDPDNLFYLDRFYAWYKYNLSSSVGIAYAWDSYRAVDTSNHIIMNTVLDVYFDNAKAASARQGDNIVVKRQDGAYPQTPTTSGGGGLGFYYTGVGYSTSSGSGLDTTERNKLLGLRDFDPDTDVVEGSETWTQAQRLIRAEAAGKVSVSGNTVNFRDAQDTKNRISATTDANGQRTAVTTDGT